MSDTIPLRKRINLPQVGLGLAIVGAAVLLLSTATGASHTKPAGPVVDGPVEADDSKCVLDAVCSDHCLELGFVCVEGTLALPRSAQAPLEACQLGDPCEGCAPAPKAAFCDPSKFIWVARDDAPQDDHKSKDKQLPAPQRKDCKALSKLVDEKLSLCEGDACTPVEVWLEHFGPDELATLVDCGSKVFSLLYASGQPATASEGRLMASLDADVVARVARFVVEPSFLGAGTIVIVTGSDLYGSRAGDLKIVWGRAYFMASLLVRGIDSALAHAEDAAQRSALLTLRAEILGSVAAFQNGESDQASRRVLLLPAPKTIVGQQSTFPDRVLGQRERVAFAGANQGVISTYAAALGDGVFPYITPVSRFGSVYALEASVPKDKP